MRKLITFAALVMLLALAGCAQGQAPSSAPASTGGAASEEARISEEAALTEETSSSVESSSAAEDGASFIIGIGDAQLTVNPADTEAASALMEQLQSGPVTVSLRAYGGFEQVGTLPWGLPTSDEQITTSPGDVMLYQGNQITIFTGSNSWAYTPLGSIEGATSESLLEALGGDAVEITLSLA